MIRIVTILLVTLFACTTAFAGEVRVQNARVTQVLAHGSYFDTDTFVVFFDKTAGGCDKMWVNTKTKQSEKVFEMVMAAFLNNISVDYSMDPDSRWSGSRGLTCEMRYIWLKK